MYSLLNTTVKCVQATRIVKDDEDRLPSSYFSPFRRIHTHTRAQHTCLSLPSDCEMDPQHIEKGRRRSKTHSHSGAKNASALHSPFLSFPQAKERASKQARIRRLSRRRD